MSKRISDAYSVKSFSSAGFARTADGYLKPRSVPLAGTDFSTMDRADKIGLLKEILSGKIHGISYSPYMDGQSPGTEISEKQIRQRMEIIRPFTNWVRCFSCIEGNQVAPRVAHELGLKTMVGVGLSEDRGKNEEELSNAIDIANQGHANILAVGNEVLLRGDLTEEELLDYIGRAQNAVKGVPVSYVDAYFLFENHPAVTEACDVLLINCYPFWESCAVEYSLLYMKEMFRRVEKVSGGKRIIISETGWPTAGTACGAAQPSFDHALEYFINTYTWAAQEGVGIFYFSSFDEAWKTGDEGDVGAYWGLWDKEGLLKYE